MPIPVPYRVKKIPLVTVIVTTHKRPLYLMRTLISLVSQLPRDELQIIVVSDLNNPETMGVCHSKLSPEDIFVRRSPCNPGESRNTGLLLAEGRYVMFLDDDDAWHPEFLTAMRQDPAIQRGELVYFNCSRVIERRLPEGPQVIREDALNVAGQVNQQIFVRNQVHMSSIAFPRELLQGLSFDPRLRTFEDWDFILSVFERKMPMHVPILSSRVFEASEETSDRLSTGGVDLGTVIDYLYIYRRHPVVDEGLKHHRAAMLATNDLHVDPQFL